MQLNNSLAVSLFEHLVIRDQGTDARGTADGFQHGY
jgi:hypothetical protein